MSKSARNNVRRNTAERQKDSLDALRLSGGRLLNTRLSRRAALGLKLVREKLQLKTDRSTLEILIVDGVEKHGLSVELSAGLADPFTRGDET